MPKQISMVKCPGDCPDVINTGLHTGAYKLWSSNSRFNGLSKQRCRSKPLKRLRREDGTRCSQHVGSNCDFAAPYLRLRRVKFHRLQDKTIHLGGARDGTYLENE
jgi:hypothetical protein